MYELFCFIADKVQSNAVLLHRKCGKKGSLRSVLSIIMSLTIVTLSIGCAGIAGAEDNATLLYAVPSVNNPYEQTLNTFTLSYCYPAQLLNQAPNITGSHENPDGLTWVNFLVKYGVVQLTGKDSHGEWKSAKWGNISFDDMLLISYCLCKAFENVYKDNTDLKIVFYTDPENISYIQNKASADSFIEMVDEWYGNEAKSENQGDELKEIAIGNNDPVLSLFPGIAWGMKKDKIMSLYGDGIIDMSSQEKEMCMSFETLYDGEVMVLFSFQDNKLMSMTAIYSEENTAKYLSDMMREYGKPIRTSSFYANLDEIEEVKDGDIAVWKTESSMITIFLQDTGSISYNPV